MIDFQSFREWQLQGNRFVKIEMGSVSDVEYISVFVYDYDLHVGQLVTSVDEIDLIGKKKQELLESLRELEVLGNEK